MLWNKEVDLKSSCSITRIRTQILKDAKIASAVNRIIKNTRFKKKVGLEEQKAQKEDRFLRGRKIAYLIYEYSLGEGLDCVNFARLFASCRKLNCE